VIYLVSTFLLFSLASWIFYLSAKKNIIQQQKETMKYEAEHIKSKLRLLHRSNAPKLYYPKSYIVKSAIYDLDKNYIFGTLPSTHRLNKKEEEGKLHYMVKVEPYYLGAAYLLVEKRIDTTAIELLQKQILFFMLGAGIFFLVLGYFLGRLFMAPMRDAIEKMNHFIQDTTHELNTPISTILTNIEMIETFGKHKENHNELKRIEIASKTLSRIYDDLTYLNLNHNYHRKITTVDMSELLQERIVYFTAMAEAKGLTLLTDISSSVMLQIDKNDAIRLLDNLISNAIKYNKPKGILKVALDKNQLIVSDTGIGIKKKDIKQIMQRFKRVNKSEGGFGIGLNIVNQVVENYGFDINISSHEGEGTKVVVIWKK
jgi:two-component system OmpR family sensor kinase